MPVTEDEMKKALKAFKKRIKLTMLDEESKLGYGPMSSGGKGKIFAIQPPAGFGAEVWKELAEKGFLKADGGGFYQLVAGK
jgi:hypothetical protein